MGVFGHWYILILLVLFWGAVLVGGVWLVMWAIRISPRGVRPDRALQILKERFARGEIDQDEYEKRKRALQQP